MACCAPAKRRESPYAYRGAPLWILLKSLFYSVFVRRVPFCLKNRALDVSAVASVPDELPIRLVWFVVEQRESITKALHVAEPAQVSCSVDTHFEELHRADTRGKPVVRHASRDNAEARLFQ